MIPMQYFFSKKSLSAISLRLFTLFLLVNISSFAQADLSKLRQEVEHNPDSLSYHQAYLKAVNVEDKEVTKQYEVWMKKFPTSAIVPFALGEALWRKELPAAKDLLVKATEINPNFAQAYFYLWIDGERWGDFEKSRAYIKKANEIEPTNPDYAFYYANTFSDTDREKYKELSLAVATNFPTSERGAQALYWLGANETDVAIKKKYYTLLKEKFPPSEFGWSDSGMSSYFDVLMNDNPTAAVKLATELLAQQTEDRGRKNWENQLNIAKNITKVEALLATNKPTEAFEILENTKPNKWSKVNNVILFHKAKVLDMVGKTDQAYELLRISYAKVPAQKTKRALKVYASKLAKTDNDIDKDIRYVRDTMAKVATDFTLKQYFEEGTSSLSDYKGKVVLLTYWFPGCGPCRGEFPHFQKVVDKFKGQDLVYLGLNIAPEQNEYVIPFMQSSGYSFIPLEDYKEREKGNLNNRGAAPVNFLIDKEGNVVFTHFRTDEHNQDVLENMISSLLEK